MMSLSVILCLVVYSFVTCFVPYLPYISFKIESYIFLAPKTSCTFFVIFQISSVIFTLKKGTPVFSYHPVDFRHILYTYKEIKRALVTQIFSIFTSLPTR